MKNKTQIFFLILLVIVGLTALAFVILPPILYGANKQVETSAPDQVVRDFYTWYLSYEGNPLSDKAYRSNSSLSENFIQRLDKETSGELIADPFLCAQDVPESVIASSPEISSKSASVEVETSFGNRFTVKLVMENDLWKIAGVTCK